MAGIYDVHAHLNDVIYAEMELSSSDIVSESMKSGVNIINNIGYDIKSSKLAILQAEKNANVYALIGIHPNEAHLFSDEAYAKISEMANATKVIGIGEIGLDYHRSDKYINIQKKAFKKQIDIALEHGLPIMLHIKDVPGSYKAYEDAFKILKDKKVKNAVIHSFEGNYEIAKKFTDQNYFLSISGELFRNKELQDTVKEITLNKLMVESDAPYSSPNGNGKKINYPKYIVLTIEKIAKLKKLSNDDVISSTRENAQVFFNIK